MRITLLFAILTLLPIGAANFAFADHHKDGDCTKGYCKMFDKKDANSDGVISKSEFLTHAEKKFSSMDADGSGDISKEEVKNYRLEKKEKYRDKSGKCGGKKDKKQ